MLLSETTCFVKITWVETHHTASFWCSNWWSRMNQSLIVKRIIWDTKPLLITWLILMQDNTFASKSSWHNIVVDIGLYSLSLIQSTECCEWLIWLLILIIFPLILWYITFASFFLERIFWNITSRSIITIWRHAPLLLLFYLTTCRALNLLVSIVLRRRLKTVFWFSFKTIIAHF